MPVKYTVVFQRKKECPDPPFPAKIKFETKLIWVTNYGNFRKEVCSKEEFSSKKAAMEASKSYKKTLEERKSCL